MAVGNRALPGGIVEDGRLRVERLEADSPIRVLYRRLPEARIADSLMDMDNDTGFADAFIH